ncbi:MAG: glycosyltransferase family 2 protein, partial [Gammaproteobacteria bacterium]|nr:glycosyltransferase family 2 protein [Gammaproteobacteria bacterium]
MEGLSSMHSGPCPRVAIITRTKDRPMFLKRAINSVLGQTFEDWQHVIVNDGGAPHDIEALVAESSTAYRGRVLLIHHPLSRGMEAAANEGIKASSSDYLVIHDDDDSWAPTFLDRCVAFMEAPPAVLATPIRGVATYSTKMIEKVAEGKFIQVASEPFNTWMSAVSLYRMAANNSIPPISFLFERSALEAVGLYREELPVLGDWEFHLRFLAQYEIGLIKEELAY